MEIKSYYIYCKGSQYGPFTADMLTTYINNGYFNENDYIWEEQKNEWILISTAPEFKDIFVTQKNENATVKKIKPDIPENLILKGTKIYYHNYRTGELQERAYIRLNIDIPAEIKTANTDNYIHVKVSNISAGGMGIELTKELNLKLDDIVIIRLFINSISKYIQLSAQIVRLRKIVTNQYDIGLKFVDTDSHDGKYLLTLLSWKAEALARAKQ